MEVDKTFGIISLKFRLYWYNKLFKKEPRVKFATFLRVVIYAREAIAGGKMYKMKLLLGTALSRHYIKRFPSSTLAMLSYLFLICLSWSPNRARFLCASCLSWPLEIFNPSSEEFPLLTHVRVNGRPPSWVYLEPTSQCKTSCQYYLVVCLWWVVSDVFHRRGGARRAARLH